MNLPPLKTVYDTSEQTLREMNATYMAATAGRWVSEYNEHISESGIMEGEFIEVYAGGLAEYITDIIGTDRPLKIELAITSETTLELKVLLANTEITTVNVEVAIHAIHA